MTTEDKLVVDRRTGGTRSIRVKVDPAWVVNAFGPFVSGESFFQDGKNTYTGPSAAFVAAATTVDLQSPATRPSLGPDGVTAAQDYVRRRGGAL